MTTAQAAQEARVVLRNVSWETYERLLAEREDSTPRFTYYRGELELMSPLLPEHEEHADNLRVIVRVLAEELGVGVRGFGSMTLRREDLQGGLEPDGCFYIASEPRIRGKTRPDLRFDPPPDLTIEVDITNPSLDKLPVYVRLGVPELWRHDGRRLTILVLTGDRYLESVESHALRGATADDISDLLGESAQLD
ncbi:MAG: Uma2 family endonuclease, partial [Chloroflexota bacterium]|nr:Uma2 family endonuclease [Chloroflexota bacterium]